MKNIILIVIFVPLLLFGCSSRNDVIRESDKDLISQSQKGAEEIRELASDPIIKRICDDIIANMKQLISFFGSPKNDKPYSPQNSEDARSQHKKDHPFPYGSILGFTGLLICVTQIMKVGMSYIPKMAPYLKFAFPALAPIISPFLAMITGSTSGMDNPHLIEGLIGLGTSTVFTSLNKTPIPDMISNRIKSLLPTLSKVMISKKHNVSEKKDRDQKGEIIETKRGSLPI